jgi:hypothetical protein
LKVELSYCKYHKIIKVNCTSHKLRRNCSLKYVVEGNKEGRMEVTLRRGRRRKKLHDDLKEKRGYWKLKEGYHCVESSLCKKLYSIPVVRQTTE